jgi:hypothetical protein
VWSIWRLAVATYTRERYRPPRAAMHAQLLGGGRSRAGGVAFA